MHHLDLIPICMATFAVNRSTNVHHFVIYQALCCIKEFQGARLMEPIALSLVSILTRAVITDVQHHVLVSAVAVATEGHIGLRLLFDTELGPSMGDRFSR